MLGIVGGSWLKCSWLKCSWLNGAAQTTVYKAMVGVMMSWPSPRTARELKRKQARDEDKVQITYLETQVKVLAAEVAWWKNWWAHEWEHCCDQKLGEYDQKMGKCDRKLRKYDQKVGEYGQQVGKCDQKVGIVRPEDG